MKGDGRQTAEHVDENRQREDAPLLLGATAGYLSRIPQRAIADVMAFGSGVLITALGFLLAFVLTKLSD